MYIYMVDVVRIWNECVHNVQVFWSVLFMTCALTKALSFVNCLKFIYYFFSSFLFFFFSHTKTEFILWIFRKIVHGTQSNVPATRNISFFFSNRHRNKEPKWLFLFCVCVFKDNSNWILNAFWNTTLGHSNKPNILKIRMMQ